MKLFFRLSMSLLLTLFLISSSILIILNLRPIYYHFIDSGEINNLYSLSEEEIKKNYDSLIDYNSGFSYKELKLPHLPSSDDGLIHFKEVRSIFILIKYLLAGVSLLLCLGIFLKPKGEGYEFLLGGGLFSISLIGLLSLFIFIDFGKIFVLFHELAFDNDLWLFDDHKDPIILYLPEKFFMFSALAIAGLIITLSLVCFIIYSITVKSKKKPKLP